MSFEFAALQTCSSEDEPLVCSETDAILYALGVGFAADKRHYPFVCEHLGLHTVPTVLSLLAARGLRSLPEFRSGRIVSMSEALELFRPVPVAVDLLVNRRLANARPSPEGHAVLARMDTEIRRARDDTAVASIHSELLLLSDSAKPPSIRPTTGANSLPSRRPDFVSRIETGTAEVLVFRLVADRNPEYVDPAAARRFGRPRPPLQDLCVQGIACRAILDTICDYDYTLIGGISMNFAGTALHGDTLLTEMWQDGNTVQFRCRTEERGGETVGQGRFRLNA